MSTTTNAAPAAASSPAPEAVIRLENLGKTFVAGDGPVLQGLDLSIQRGQFVALLGASGSGKTTLLNVVAGLEDPTEGSVSAPAQGAAMMFQDAGLFPWLTAGKNVELALELAGIPKADRADRVQELLELVRLPQVADKRPHELSGGMRQRVGLARALAQEREVLLMDEPFSALDAITRDLLQDEVLRIWEVTGRTIVFITHNVSEAVHLGQRVLLLSSRPGRIVQEWDTGPWKDPDSYGFEASGQSREETLDELTRTITHRLREEIGRHARSSRT
ncbi:ABC transporter ATP-binding protein [Kocuria coralli]|uniref:ABC transporter ATP-binding protein n=1 Tax=Kocuria coralli TaxID=1461025 RepID=A0A5J5KX85_9MICC|nr:ABC transporter ATP-binding protein [Kocuria coralli]KAA9393890.1 ABC transporter ATP-binding protein [Kocuria coralli]